MTSMELESHLHSSVRIPLRAAPRLAVLACLLAAIAVSGSPPSAPPLVAHWRFDEGSGRTVRDIQGNFPGSLNLGASFTNAGISGSAIALNAGFSGVVNFGNVLPLTNTAFSISVWFKTPIGDSTPEAPLFAKHQPWSENGYYLILNSGNATLSGYGGFGAFANAAVPVNDGQWHHAVLVSTGAGEVRLHVDGGAPVATASGGAVRPSPADFLIGGIDPPPPARRFEGVLDEIQIYAAALDRDAVDYLFRNPSRNLSQQEVVTFRPASGAVQSPVLVSISTSIPGGQLRYTTDGSEPSGTSSLYSDAFSLQVSGIVTVKARVFVNGFPVSEMYSVTYERDSGIRYAPSAEFFTNSIDVEITSSLPGAELRYTLDGTDPTASSSRYSTPVRLDRATTLKTRAYVNGFPVTEIISMTYRRVYATESDGIPSSWREQYFGPNFRTDPRAAAEADPDADGSDNLQEFHAKTHPLDPASGGLALEIRAVPELRFPAVPGRKYQILRRSTLEDPNPKAIAEITAEGSEVRFVDRDAGLVVHPAFYTVAPVKVP